MLRLALLLRRLKPDITLGYAIKPVIYGTLAAWLARVPRRFAMIEGLGYVFTPPEGAEPLKRKAVKRRGQHSLRCGAPDVRTWCFS